MTKEQYWDKIFTSRRENILKRQHITRKVFGMDIIDKNVLEIGCGLALTAAAVTVAICGYWKYSATEVSKVAIDKVRMDFGFNVKQSDITSIPYQDSCFDMIFAFDTLEHIEPEARQKGYEEINRVLKPFATIAINMPLSESAHDVDFDFPFSIKDVIQLFDTCGMGMQTYEEYACMFGATVKRYAWIVGKR